MLLLLLPLPLCNYHATTMNQQHPRPPGAPSQAQPQAPAQQTHQLPYRSMYPPSAGVPPPMGAAGYQRPLHGMGEHESNVLEQVRFILRVCFALLDDILFRLILAFFRIACWFVRRQLMYCCFVAASIRRMFFANIK